MIYPEPLRKGSRIAITAFSSGIAERHDKRFQEVVRTLRERGYDVVVGNCLKSGKKHVSASKEQRADELMRFLTDDNLDAVAPPWGGELAIELLPLLDFERISRAKPKWIFGFSDVSTITAAINSIVGWATVHSSNLMDLVDANVEPLIANTLSYLETPVGGIIQQNSSEMNTRKWPEIESDPLAYVVGDKKTEWKWLTRPMFGDAVSGRLIGGCWDTLFHLFETPYVAVSELNSKYEEGLLLYLENAEMSPCDLVRAIHNMQFRGVFNNVNGLILGRNFRADSELEDDLTYLDVLKEHLANKNIPIMYDVDIGHVPPNLTLINGSVAEVRLVDGQGSITQWLK